VAHARVVALDPQPGMLFHPPLEVRVTFSEPVTAFGRGIDVISPSGRLVSDTAVASGDSLSAAVDSTEEGTYLVEWRVVAQDTHPSRGTYTFSVGHSSPTPAGLATGGDLGSVAPLGLILQALGRWLHFLGFALAFGVYGFSFLVLREPEPAPRLRRLITAGILLLVAAEPVALAGQAASFGSLDQASLADVLGSAFGRVLALRLGAPLLLWGILGAVRSAPAPAGWAIVGVGAALALVDGLAGHTIPGLPTPVAYLLTAVHVGSMVAWAGGFAGLLAALPGRAGKARLVARFGRIATVAVGLLVASGGLLALVHLRSPGDLAFSSYGLALAVKVAVVAIAIGAAWIGVRRFRAGHPEALALAGVLALASLLASLPPPR